MTIKRNAVYGYFNEHAKRCAPSDFSGQVKRSINGVTVSAAQVDMIIAKIKSSLDIETTDTVLDLCCGNGMLSDAIFAECKGGLGVDFAEYLVGIAQKSFADPARRYVLDDVEHFIKTDAEPRTFTKAFCYSSLQYFDRASAREILCTLRSRYSSLKALLLGNLPDKTLVRNFYYNSVYVPGIENAHESPIGLWWTTDEILALAADTGWTAETSRMPADFYAAGYRFDAVLTPRA